MQALNSGWRFRDKVPLILLLSVLAQSCGWQKTMTFPSRSRKAAIEIWQTGLANEYGARVELVTAQRRTLILENRRDATVYFVHVYWSPDETKVGILATGMNIWDVACDVRTGKPISFEQIRKEFADSISKIYPVPRGEDPIGWAASSDAHIAFFKMHPEIRLSYK